MTFLYVRYIELKMLGNKIKEKKIWDNEVDDSIRQAYVY